MAYAGYQGYDPERDRLEQRRNIAQALQQGALETGPKSLPEGIAQIGKALIARQAMKKADKAGVAYDSNQKRIMDALIGQMSPPGAAEITQNDLGAAKPFDLKPGAMTARKQEGAVNDSIGAQARALYAATGDQGATLSFMSDRNQQAIDDRRYDAGEQRAREQEALAESWRQQTFNRTGDHFGTTSGLQRDELNEKIRSNKATEALAGQKLDAETTTLGMPDFGDENSFRGQYLGQAKSFNDVKDAATRIRSVKQATTPAQQMALLYGYMKLLDPGTGVKEGEYASAENTTGIPGKILNAYESARNGVFLNPEQVSGFLEQADAQYKAAEKNYVSTVLEPYRAMAPRYNMDPSIIQDFRLPAQQARPNIAQMAIEGLGDMAKGFGGMFMQPGRAQQQPPPNPAFEQLTDEQLDAEIKRRGGR